MATPHLKINWTHTDPEPNQVHFRLYENDVMIVDNIGEMKFSLLMEGKAQGTYTYEVDAVKYGIASDKSNSASINFTKPMAPENLAVSWVESSV